MAFNKQKEIDFIIILLYSLIVTPVLTTTNDDCKGKAFHCVNSTHFKICVDFGGVSKTVDDFLIQCPPGTACTDSNYFECEYQIPTTSAPVAVQSDVTNELSDTTVSPPWELLEVTTFHPISNNERSIELLENSTIALPETVSKVAGTETVTTVSGMPVNDVLNDVITESENKTTISDLSESENNNNYSKPTESIINNNITSPTIPDGTNDLSGNNLSANISVTIENYSTTESAISIDLFNTIITTSSNTVKVEDFASTKLINSAITDSLSINNLSAAVTAENYSGTESEISIDLYEPVITTLPTIENADNTSTTLSFPVETDNFRVNTSLAEVSTEDYADIEKGSSVFLRVITTPFNSIGNENFTSSTLYPPVKSDDLMILKSPRAAAVPSENYSGTESETLVTSSNNEVNTHSTTITLLSPVTTESQINNRNIKINLTVTSDSYLANTQQNTTDRNSSNFLTESATNTNEFYTNTVQKTFHDRVDDYPLHENSTHTNRIYEISSSLQNFDLNQRLFSTTAENTQQDTTVTHFGQTTTKANMLYTNTPNNEEYIILNINDISSTQLYATISDSHPITEDVVNSSPGVSLTTESDSYVVDAQKDTTERAINSLTLTTSTTQDVYTTPDQSISQVDETAMHENGSSILSKSDFLSTVGYDESYSTTSITVALKNTKEKISPKEQSDISPKINKSYSFSDKVNNELLETTAIQSSSVIDFTTNTDSYYEVNLSITSTVIENEFQRSVAKKPSNNTTVESSRHINGTDNNIIDEITTYLPQNTDFTTSAKSDNVGVSFTTAMNVSLNDTVEELSMKGKSHLLSSVTTGNASASEIVVTSLLSDMSDLARESYIASTHMNVTKVELPISSAIDVTTLYYPTAQNIVTEPLTNEFYSTVTKEDYGSTQNFGIQQNSNDNTPSMVPSFPKLKDNLRELSTNLSEPIVTFEAYEQTTKADTDISETQPSSYGSLRSTTASTESSINNSVKELSRNESNNNIYDSSTRIADKEQTANPINGVLTATSVTKSWSTMNDTVQVFLSLNPTPKVTVDNEITPVEFQNQPTTANYAFDYITTTDSFITDGMKVSSNVTKEGIAKTTLKNENQFLSKTVSVPKHSSLTNDNFNVDVINEIYSSTSPNSPVIENYSYKNYLSENITESSMSESDNLDIPQIIHSTAFAKVNKSTIYNIEFTETDKSSINFNIVDELSVSTENILTRPSVYVLHSLNSSIDKDRNNVRPTFELNSNQISTQTLLKNTFASTERTTPFKSTNNPLKSITAQASSFSLKSNNTQLDIENIRKENVIKLLNVTKSDLEITASKINVTNEKPMHTVIYRNVDFSTQLNEDIIGVTELDTDKISADDTTSDIGPPITENNLSPNIGHVNNATISKNISRQHTLPANINKDINTTKEESEIRDSVMSGELNTQDKIEKIVPLLNHHLQNISINSNKSKQFHTNQNIVNLTKPFNNSRFFSVVNTDANLYKHNVKSISFNILDKKQYQTLDTVNKSIVNLNNLSINLETRHDQNNSFKIVPHKTRKDDINAFHINAENKEFISTPMLTSEDKRKEHNITRIIPVELNNKNLPNDYKSTKSEFNCHNRYRGKYSDKNDCQNFYICMGRSAPIFGKCPNNTVFSEISKQCTKNLSHCIRNNQFQCTSAGRYIDIFSDQFYYICAKKVEGYVRFKLQCQKGYHLDKTKLKCILDSINVSMSNEDSSKTDSEKSTIESKSIEDKESKNQTKNFECKKAGNFVYPDDCRKYYQCTKSGKSEFRRKIKKCDSDEVFNHEKRKCVDDDSYECKD